MSSVVDFMVGCGDGEEGRELWVPPSVAPRRPFPNSCFVFCSVVIAVLSFAQAGDTQTAMPSALLRALRQPGEASWCVGHGRHLAAGRRTKKRKAA